MTKTHPNYSVLILTGMALSLIGCSVTKESTIQTSPSGATLEQFVLPQGYEYLGKSPTKIKISGLRGDYLQIRTKKEGYQDSEKFYGIGNLPSNIVIPLKKK